MDETPSRTERKRAQIMDAATSAFLEHGYKGTSMDLVAAAARVSKQTVYKHFADKEQLFQAILLAAMEPTVQRLTSAAPVTGGDDLAADLLAVTRNLVQAIMRPEVLRLRRLLIGESARFPLFGGAYYDQSFSGGLAALAKQLSVLAEGGGLRLPDPLVAAEHLAGMALWVPMNRAMFTGSDQPLSADELDHYCGAAVRDFLAAYAAAA
ncbi:TetR/AcrR family transcriptional regulator [Asanoa siamensis]|uniref:TetR family transcriptional regulator n=1 Tax=Asanoa siamensis TaxID=926357 RepID=A0ABQ4CLZ3_9ACTN|nr:TetR/AcrR family transcriptional regulator [Asanoa siamensis]GIF72310.1 TetR family transcriptional regulator [Asanoa siamensis]